MMGLQPYCIAKKEMIEINEQTTTKVEYQKDLEKKEKKVVIEAIPYRTFKEKIAITKQFYGKAKMEIFKGFVYRKSNIKGVRKC